MVNIISDLHIHSLASGDAFSTIYEIVNEARKKKLLSIGISEHGYKMPTSVKHEYYYRSALQHFKEIKDLKVYVGVESSVVNSSGEVSIPNIICNGVDYLILSFHSFAWEEKNKDIEINTFSLINCIINQPNIKILGHLNERVFEINIEKIIPYLIKNNIALEINNGSLLKTGIDDYFKNIIYKCRDAGIKFIVNSDAHYAKEVGLFNQSLKLIQECSIPESLIINTNQETLDEFIMR